MNIPVNIEVGCMALVLIPIKQDNYINVIGKWCEVIKIYDDSIKIKESSFKIPLFAIEQFTFGSVGIPNPDFNLKQVLKVK